MIYRAFGLLSIAAFLGYALPAAAQDSKPALFTAAQAQQGAALYASQCAACHGPQLEGSVGPALSGSTFRQLAAAKHFTPKSLLEVISKTMPMTAPGTLKPEEYAALVAFILQRSEYPAGSQVLTKDSANLDSLDLGGGAPAAAGDPAGVRYASAGVYTDDQAARGQQLYTDNCMICHGGELEGAPGGPPLSGRTFITHWFGMPVGAIHTFIDKNMPPGNGGALGAAGEADILAYILAKNGLATGPTPLPADPDGLNGILLK